MYKSNAFTIPTAKKFNGIGSLIRTSSSTDQDIHSLPVRCSVMERFARWSVWTSTIGCKLPSSSPDGYHWYRTQSAQQRSC
eukprot:scaffold34685_cov183-Amphora_coffeaeformis.AAC.27